MPTITVRSGDTLFALLRDAGVRGDRLAEAAHIVAARNGLASPDRIRPGPLDVSLPPEFYRRDGFTDPGAPAGGSRRRTLLDRTADRLVALGRNELHREHTASLGSVGTERASVGVRLFEEIYRSNDPRVTGDAHRMATTRAMGRAVWARTGGMLDANLGLGVAVPLGGAVASFGFSTRGVLRYETLAPYTPNGQGVVDLARNNTVDLPLSADRALRMRRGSEFTLTGTGSAGASAGVGYGASAASGPVTLSASVGASFTHTVSGELSVHVKRLDGERVYVRVGRGTGDASRTTVGAHAGVSDVDLRGFWNTRGPIADALRGRAESRARDVLNEVVGIELSHTAGRAEADRTLDAFVLDLGTPAGREAYEGLLRLDLGPADRLARSGAGGASRVTYVEHTEDRTGRTVAEVGPLKLLLAETLRRDRTGVVTSRNGVVRFRDATFRSRARSIFASGEQRASWEGVNITFPGRAPTTFYHLRLEREDGRTRSDEAAEFQRFAEAVHAHPTGPVTSHPRDETLFRSAFGETRSSLDLFFTEDGLRKLSTASEQQVFAAYARAVARIEGTAALPLWADPARRQEAIRLYSQVRDAESDSQAMQLKHQYRRRFGRNMAADWTSLQIARDLSRSVASMRGRSPQAWTQLFADLGQRTLRTERGRTISRLTDGRSSAWKQMAALAQLAGTDQTLVHDLRLEGERIRYVGEDEGYLPLPDDVVEDLIGPP